MLSLSATLVGAFDIAPASPYNITHEKLGDGKIRVNKVMMRENNLIQSFQFAWNSTHGAGENVTFQFFYKKLDENQTDFEVFLILYL